MSTAGRRSGRRPGRTNTRQDILDAARTAFAAEGYDRTSIRRIAANAKVDPALVHHYFSSKEQLFLTAIEAPFDPTEMIPALANDDIESIGHRLVALFIELWDGENGERIQAFLRVALVDPNQAALAADFLLTWIVRGALNQVIPTLDHAATRGSLVASQLLGLATTRYLLKLPPLVGLDADTLVAAVGPTIQRYLTANAAELGITDE